MPTPKTGEKHTEGPWTIQHGVMAGPDGKPLGACSGRPDAEAAANMALIAAAPEMLAMLKDWPLNMSADEWNAWHERRKALIAKATGQEER